jgi:hypothetical protein
LHFSTGGLTIRVTRLGWDEITPLCRNQPQARKLPENAAHTPSRVVGSRDGAWDFHPGFHPLPHRTVHEVFPHTALRQPSSWSIQDIHCLDFSITCHIRSSRSMFASWLSSIVCAGVLVICLVVGLAFQHAPSLTSSLNLVEVETLPSE